MELSKKKGVTLTFSVTGANCEECFYNIVAAHLPSSPSTTPVSGRKPNIRSYSHNRLAGTFVRPPPRWQPRKVSKSLRKKKQKKTPPTQLDRTLAADTTLTAATFGKRWAG